MFSDAWTDLNARVKLEALGNVFMVKAVELDTKLQKIERQLHRFFPPHRRDDYGQAAF